jgi:16S rRNA (guanine(966)-N(2))-methyltransferase RsmD
MRISGGELKGVQLRTPPKYSTRPTTNIVRQAIFSILENNINSWRRVLDLYAGSGALGIEALSRKADWVDFVDHKKRCCDIIKYNLQKTRTLHKAHVYCCAINKAIAFLGNSYDIVFIDPPYSDPSANLLTKLAKSKAVGENSTIVICHANRFPLKANYDGLQLIEQRHYGDTFISIYQKES